MTGATSGAGIVYPSGAPEFTPGFSGVRVARSLDFCALFYWSFFVLLTLFYWSLYCLSFFDLRILITPLVSSNSSYIGFRYNLVTNCPFLYQTVLKNIVAFDFYIIIHKQVKRDIFITNDRNFVVRIKRRISYPLVHVTIYSWNNLTSLCVLYLRKITDNDISP